MSRSIVIWFDGYSGARSLAQFKIEKKKNREQLLKTAGPSRKTEYIYKMNFY